MAKCRVVSSNKETETPSLSAPVGAVLSASMKPHGIKAENAAQILAWIRTRGGVAVWHSTSRSCPSLSWSCPLNDEHGQRKGKPYAAAEKEPRRIITSTDDVIVHTDVEVKRFPIEVQPGKQGSFINLTDESRVLIEKAVAAAGADAYHLFDQTTHAAVILAPNGNSMTLTKWPEMSK